MAFALWKGGRLEEGKIGSLPRSMQNFEGRFRLGGLARKSRDPKRT
jgi:hypothetical protein